MKSVQIETGHVSIYDIASVAGVNPSTVSRALNNRDRIGTETKERILKIARELGYQPSAVARSLVTSRTLTIGVVAPFLGEMFIGRVIDGIESTAEKHGYQVMFSTSRHDPDRELKIATSFQRARVDAVIIVTTHLRSTHEIFARTLGVPVVVIGQQDRDSEIPVVAMDDALAIRQAVEHLLSLGHRSFGYVGVSDRLSSNSCRANAYLDTVRQNLPDSTVHVTTPCNKNDLSRGEAALPELLKRGITAVQCYNDLVAMGLLSAALRMGLDIPGDFSVIGFDDLEISAALPVPLTTIHQPRLRLGRHAVEMVLELLNGAPVSQRMLSGDLVIRQSTGKPGNRGK